MRNWKEVPYISAALVIINVILFMICTFTGDLLYNMGGLEYRSVVDFGQYGRLLWSMFLHADVQHIFNNMVILFFLGAMIEKEIGHLRYGMFYLISGLGGSVLSLIYKGMTGTTAISFGASGAVFGLDGVLLALVLFSGKRMENVTLPRVFLMIGYSLYSGFTGHNIDNAAHVGGLVTGFLLGAIMCMTDNRKRNESERCSIEY